MSEKEPRGVKVGQGESKEVMGVKRSQGGIKGSQGDLIVQLRGDQMQGRR